jgi:hypothetical protein
MSYERDNINNFGVEFDKFSSFWNNWDISQNQNFNYLKQFNTKLRMPFAIKQIELDYEFLREKMEDMKELHKFLYKLTDLWFAYETFFKLYEKINNFIFPNNFSKTNWIDEQSYSSFQTQIVSNSINTANNQLNIDFVASDEIDTLKNYLTHCANLAAKSNSIGQKNNLNRIVDNYGQYLSFRDLLSVTYAIRNNYVHNGEATITNAGLDNLNFRFDETQKLKLVKICYNFLAIFTVNIANTLIDQHN